MNIKETRSLAESVWTMNPPGEKEVAWALLESCNNLEKLQQSLEIDMDDGMNVVIIAGDPILADVVKAAWPSHVVGTPVLARAVEMLEDHPRLEHRLSDAMLQVKALLGENATHMKRVSELISEVRISKTNHTNVEDQHNG